MYRLLIETLLGVNLEGEQLRLAPRLPSAWTTCKVHYRYRNTVYHITIVRLPAHAPAVNLLSLDGQALSGTTVPLRDDHREHFVEMKIR
jgi:cellobiose phosphorylase